ncbi:transposase [Clostridiales bacterium NSJ-32]|uniref:Transposase n=2 Tax=Bianquea renquensis TaxID=2763661 RepID=A0A926DTV7_9FIRM|nr:transposase [Bianquea renquensis]
MHDAEKLIELCDKTGELDDTIEYQLLIRILKERTIIDDDGNRRLRKKEEAENSSEVLLKPSDPEATFRYKAGGRNLVYVGNVVKSVGEKGSLITDYAYEKNIYADNQFMKDYLEQLDAFDEGAFLVADGAYSGEMNSRIVASDTLKEECNSCPYKDRCHPRFLKTRVRKEVSWKAVGRAKQLQYMKTEECNQYARFRNGVEAIPSLLRRRYKVDKIPTHGKNPTRFYFGFKIAALYLQKLLDYINNLDHCVPRTETA